MSTKNIGAIALIKPVLDQAGIGEIVDRHAPMEREGRGISNGETALMLQDYGLDFIGAMRMSQGMKELAASVPDDGFRPLDVKGVRGPKEGYSATETPIELSHDGRKMEARG